MKRPDYGSATPEDLARALMSERLKASPLSAVKAR